MAPPEARGHGYTGGNAERSEFKLCRTPNKAVLARRPWPTKWLLPNGRKQRAMICRRRSPFQTGCFCPRWQI